MLKTRCCLYVSSCMYFNGLTKCTVQESASVAHAYRGPPLRGLGKGDKDEIVTSREHEECAATAPEGACTEVWLLILFNSQLALSSVPRSLICVCRQAEQAALALLALLPLDEAISLLRRMEEERDINAEKPADGNQAAPAEADSVAMDVEAVALFRKMDINGDGVLDLSELRAGMADSGMLDTEIEALFFSLDFITDNKVSV